MIPANFPSAIGGIEHAAASSFTDSNLSRQPHGS